MSSNVFTMEKDLKRVIVNAAEAIKKKVRKMRDIETENDKALEKVFKPIINPINEIVDTNKQFKDQLKSMQQANMHETLNENSFDNTLLKRESDVYDYKQTDSEESDVSSNHNENDNNDQNVDDFNNSNLSFKTIASDKSDSSKEVSSWSLEAMDDVPYGVRNERGKQFMGTARVVLYDNYVQVGSKKYKMTEGIKECLFKKIPRMDLITEDDLKHYKSMILDTNVHRRDFSPTKPIKSNKGRKYLNIIRPMFKLRKISTSTDGEQHETHEGKGLPLLKKWKKNVDYVYWDDPNELIDRLRLLIASRNAGNTGLDNEIISIIEELRESGCLVNLHK